jgi:hypothetical protein
MTQTKTIDEREDTTPTFGILREGDAFTSEGGSVVFIKTEIMYDRDKNPYNTVALDGEFYWFDDDEEVQPVQELEIVIKK